jgi:hypothetical protein
MAAVVQPEKQRPVLERYAAQTRLYSSFRLSVIAFCRPLPPTSVILPIPPTPLPDKPYIVTGYSNL